MKRAMMLLLTAMFSMAVLSGCNTMAGAGKDVQKGRREGRRQGPGPQDGKC